AEPCPCGDLVHLDVLAVLGEQLGGRVEHGFAVASRVRAQRAFSSGHEFTVVDRGLFTTYIRNRNSGSAYGGIMIVVTTPTGRIGRELITRLLDHDAEVRVIVRDAARLDAETRARVEVVEGSHADGAALDRALVGADALFWLVPPNPAAPSAEEHYLDFARDGAAGIRRHRVGHVVAVTSAGHGWTAPAGVLSAAFAMDAELRTSGAAYRAV